MFCRLCSAEGGFSQSLQHPSSPIWQTPRDRAPRLPAGPVQSLGPLAWENPNGRSGWESQTQDFWTLNVCSAPGSLASGSPDPRQESQDHQHLLENQLLSSTEPRGSPSFQVPRRTAWASWAPVPVEQPHEAESHFRPCRPLGLARS